MGQDLVTPTPHPITLAAEEGASLSSGSLRLYAQAGQTIVGCIDLYAYDPLNHRCAVGIVVASTHRRKGFALTMLHELDQLSAHIYHLHQLYADIAATNQASIALFAKAGYTQCGHFQDWLAHHQQYIDTIRMQHLL